MIYFGSALVLIALWFGSWWMLAPIAFFAGYAWPKQSAWKFAFGAGLTWAALSFLADGRSAGIVSQRMAGMFSLPSPSWLFLVIALLGFVTVFLWFKAGASSRVLIKK